MPPQKPLPPIGSDVTGLIPNVGADVTSLMGGQQPPAAAQHPLARFGQAAVDVGIGAVKGAGSTVLGLSQLINRGTAAVGLSKPISDETWNRARQDFTTPQNTAQSLGKGAEQLGEFFVPGGAVARGVKAVGASSKFANTALRAGLEGLSSAGVHSAQTGSTEGAATVGAIGAAAPVLSAAAARFGPALQRGAEKKVAQALGAAKERFKAISAKRAPEILKRGLGGSRESLLADATVNAKAAGKAVDDVLTEHGAMPLSTKSVTEALEQAKSGFVVDNELSALEAFNTGAMQTPGAKLVGNKVTVPVVLNERAVNQLTKLQSTIGQLGESVPVEKLVAVRRVWDDVVTQAGGHAHRSPGSNFGIPLDESTEAWAKKQGADALRALFNANVPNMKAVNQEFAFWADLRSVLRATEARTQPQGPGLNRMVTSGTGVVVGALSGTGDMQDRMQTAFLGGIAGPKIYQALTSSRWRLMDAKLRHGLADALMSGKAEDVSTAMGKVMAALGSQVSQTSDGRK